MNRPERVLKICNMCKKKKYLVEFGNHSTGSKGLNSVCKDCKSVMNHLQYVKRKEQKINSKAKNIKDE